VYIREHLGSVLLTVYIREHLGSVLLTVYIREHLGSVLLILLVFCVVLFVFVMCLVFPLVSLDFPFSNVYMKTRFFSNVLLVREYTLTYRFLKRINSTLKILIIFFY
jgi:hypothetical protein